MPDVPRPWMFAAAVACCAVAACLLPVAARTSMEIHTAQAEQAERFPSQPPPVETAAPGSRDPFVPDAQAALAARPELIVHAIIAGADPRALVEDDGRMRVVQVGDSAAGSRITAIARDSVILASGTHVRLDVRP